MNRQDLTFLSVVHISDESRSLTRPVTTVPWSFGLLGTLVLSYRRVPETRSPRRPLHDDLALPDTLVPNGLPGNRCTCQYVSYPSFLFLR